MLKVKGTRGRVRLRLIASAAGLVAMTGVVLAWPTNPSCTGTVTASTAAISETNSDKETTFTVTVASISPAGTKWRDLKLIPPEGKKFPKYANPASGEVQVTGGTPQPTTQGWEHTKVKSGAIVIYTGTGGSDPAGFGNGTYTFKLNFEEDATGKLRSCNWEMTDAGTKDDTSPIDDDGGQAESLQIPTLTASINGGAPGTAAIGATTTLACLTEPDFADREYEVFTSRSLNAEGTDAKGIFINDVTDPLMPAWNLTFNNRTGTIAAGGGTEDPFQVVVPNDPTLVGNSFYVVFAVKDPGGGGGLTCFSVPLEVTFTAP